MIVWRACKDCLGWNMSTCGGGTCRSKSACTAVQWCRLHSTFTESWDGPLPNSHPLCRGNGSLKNNLSGWLPSPQHHVLSSTRMHAFSHKYMLANFRENLGFLLRLLHICDLCFHYLYANFPLLLLNWVSIKLYCILHRLFWCTLLDL